MSYNNIGLKTPKGSSTSGHIQRSLADHKGSNQNYNKRNRKANGKPNNIQAVAGSRPKDVKLVDHLQKREIELQVAELRDELEDGSDDDEMIEQKCRTLRERLTKARDVKRTNYIPRQEREL